MAIQCLTDKTLCGEGSKKLVTANPIIAPSNKRSFQINLLAKRRKANKPPWGLFRGFMAYRYWI